MRITTSRSLARHMAVKCHLNKLKIYQVFATHCNKDSETAEYVISHCSGSQATLSIWESQARTGGAMLPSYPERAQTGVGQREQRLGTGRSASGIESQMHSLFYMFSP